VFLHFKELCVFPVDDALKSVLHRQTYYQM
jgi:hypothetical protein